ncbi:MAG TPA: hypothetical protein VKI20_06145 [Acidimicrobiales bacterium]|nr:hypothetical protein [Acidimicrobiales bacterium]
MAGAVVALAVATVRLEHRVSVLRSTILTGGATQAVMAALADPLHRDVRLRSSSGSRRR